MKERMKISGCKSKEDMRANQSKCIHINNKGKDTRPQIVIQRHRTWGGIERINEETKKNDLESERKKKKNE